MARQPLKNKEIKLLGVVLIAAALFIAIVLFSRVFIYSLIDSLGSWPTFLIMLFLAMSLMCIYALLVAVSAFCQPFTLEISNFVEYLILALAVVAVNGVTFSLEELTDVKDLAEDIVKSFTVMAPFLAFLILMNTIFVFIFKKLSVCQNRKNIP
ncbi:MAG: hypothetical protein QW284_04545 [Ignisphaera sp.]